MFKMSHINVLEKYAEYRSAIHSMLSSILSCFADEKMFEQNQKELTDMLNSLCNYYPFISLLYLFDTNGKQLCKGFGITKPRVCLVFLRVEM